MLADYVYHVSFRRYRPRPLKLLVAVKLRSRRKMVVFDLRFVGGGYTTDFEHTFLNRTLFQVCGRVKLSSVQRTELNQNRPHARKYVQNLGYPLRYKSGAQNHLFRTTSQLNGKFNVYIFGTKHDIDNPSSALTITRVSYIVPKCHVLCSTNGFKLDRHFTHPM